MNVYNIILHKSDVCKHRYFNLHFQVWLYPDESKDPIFVDIQERVRQMTGLSEELIKNSDFQVTNIIYLDKRAFTLYFEI